MSEANFTLRAWQRLSSKPGGKWLFSRFVCFKAPYFASIRPLFVELRPGRSEIRAPLRRAVTNHIGTFHAIAMCCMAELAGGTLTDVSIPLTHRWIPKGMTVEYLKKAATDLRAVAELPPSVTWTDAQELPVTVNVLDAAGETVFRAVIRMWVTKKGP